MLSSQERLLIEQIQQQPGILPVTLASNYSVSERTIRTYINQVNTALGSSAHVVKQRGKGYILVIDNQEQFDELFNEKAGMDYHPIPQSPEERIAYLLNDLLSRTDWITIDDLADILFISRNAITKDLKHVEDELENFDLELERRPHYGIRVTGPEMKKRLCLANSVLNSFLENSSTDSKVTLNTISTIVEKVLNEESFQVNSAAYQNLMVHIGITITRIRDNCFVPMDDSQLNAMRGGREFEVAQKIAQAVGETFDINFPEAEIGYIAIHLAGKRTLYTADSDSDDGLVISDEVWNVVSEMLNVVWESVRFDFRNDLELRMNLARHIVPLSVRLRYSMSISNPLLSDIKRRYPLAYSMAVDASSVLRDHYGSEPSDEEIGYLALAFALAIERKKNDLPKKNILVVCASGQGSASLLEWSYRHQFGQYLNKIITCDINHIDHIDFSHIDYVFTTVPINRQLPVPVRKVDFFLEGESANLVFKTLVGSMTESELEQFFSPELFMPHLKARTKDEALDLLCDRIAQVRAIPNDFRELVAKREAAAQTSFGNQVAMPHPYKVVTDETFVCVGITDEPINWNGHAVRAIFLVSIARNKTVNLDSFYKGMAMLLTSTEAIQTLVGNQEWGNFLELLKKYGNTSEKE